MVGNMLVEAAVNTMPWWIKAVLGAWVVALTAIIGFALFAIVKFVVYGACPA